MPGAVMSSLRDTAYTENDARPNTTPATIDHTTVFGQTNPAIAATMNQSVPNANPSNAQRAIFWRCSEVRDVAGAGAESSVAIGTVWRVVTVVGASEP
jgi:hypothetical protein